MADMRIPVAVEARQRVTRVLVAIVALLAGFGLCAWWTQYERRALLALPEPERVRIYERTLDSMRLLCGDSRTTGAFEARCREQALFLSEFPECERSCRALLDPHLPRPVR